MAKKEVKYYQVFLPNGKQVHFKDGTTRTVSEEYVENNSKSFDHNTYTYDHSEWVDE